VSNRFHLEHPLQVCQQCNRRHKSSLLILTGGPQNLALSWRQKRRALTTSVPISCDRGDTRTQHTSPFIEIEETRVHNKRLFSLRDRRHTYTTSISFRQDRGDAREMDVSLFIQIEETQVHSTCLWCRCNRLCVGACYQSSVWAQRNNH
jgi:hypothetical protein